MSCVRQSGKVPRVVLVLLVLAGLGAARLVQSLVAFKNEDTRITLFSTVIDDYLELEASPDSGAEPYIRGKVVTVDQDSRVVDRATYAKLPASLKAGEPGEVGTVGLIRWRRERAGIYVEDDTNRQTGEAFRSTADLVLVDAAERRVIVRRSFVSDAPATALSREGDYQSERPIFQLVDYLERLPRK